VALGLLRADAPGTITGAPQDWPRWAVLLPHVLAATSLANPAAGSAGQDVAADTAWLLDRAATYLQVHAPLADARPLAERALAIDEAALGPDHPTVATLLDNLAGILRDLGLTEDARRLQERAHSAGQAAQAGGQRRRGMRCWSTGGSTGSSSASRRTSGRCCPISCW
jgi:hypothetical protein